MLQQRKGSVYTVTFKKHLVSTNAIIRRHSPLCLRNSLVPVPLPIDSIFWNQQSQHRTDTNRVCPIRSFVSTTRPNYDEQWLLNQAIATVRQYDPGAYIPGYLLSDMKLRTSYFAIRAFWIETGLRFGSTAYVSPNSTPTQHIQWWKCAIHNVLYPDSPTQVDCIVENKASTGTDIDSVVLTVNTETHGSYEDHPVLQLLQLLQERYGIQWTKQHYDEVLIGRMKDLDVKQYSTMYDLIHYAQQSCGSLNKLLLQSTNIKEESNPMAYKAAELVGIGHGLSNALRQSVAVLSTAGKLIIPQELTTKYNVKSPRYLLSALSTGDEQCEYALQQCVQDIVACARKHIQEARILRNDILREPNGNIAIKCLLSSIPSEIFLNRLQHYNYKLTDRNLRYTNLIDHAICTTHIISAYYQSKY
jgi:hypothetical protein